MAINNLALYRARKAAQVDDHLAAEASRFDELGVATKADIAELRREIVKLRTEAVALRQEMESHASTLRLKIQTESDIRLTGMSSLHRQILSAIGSPCGETYRARLRQLGPIISVGVALTSASVAAFTPLLVVMLP